MNDVDVLVYTSYLHIIGGIETFVLNFVDLLKDDYKIAVMCPRLPDEMAAMIRKKVTLYPKDKPVTCTTLIMVRMMDTMPGKVAYDKVIRMCHACNVNPTWQIKADSDKIVHVSKASKDSFHSDGDVIYNPLFKSPDKALLLVSATRIPALDKGKNADRMLKLAEMLNQAKINFIWLNFSDAPLKNAPKGFINVGTFHDLQSYIARADYLVQLSDQEGFGYSVLEALVNNTAVICTPFSTTAELGVKDGENGYIVPFDMNFDVSKLKNVPKFNYEWKNDGIKRKWMKLLNSKPKKSAQLTVEVLRPYLDIVLNEKLRTGKVLKMPEARAHHLARLGFVQVVKGGK